MALVLNEEQRLLKDTAKEFIQASSPVESLRQLRAVVYSPLCTHCPRLTGGVYRNVQGERGKYGCVLHSSLRIRCPKPTLGQCCLVNYNQMEYFDHQFR